MTVPNDMDDDKVDDGGNPNPEPTPVVNDDSHPKPRTYTELEYRGLQAVIAKRDNEVKSLKDTILSLETKLGEANSTVTTTTNDKTTLGTQLNVAEQKVANLEKELAAAKKTLSFRDIIMKDFSDIASAASFIPETETEEEFRQKATEFRATLTNLVGGQVKNVLGGSSVPVSNPDTTLGGDDEDKAYREVVALAGRAGKEVEYKAAYERYQRILQAKKTTG